jgi:hypothetical protein
MADIFSVLRECRSVVLKWIWGTEVLVIYIRMAEDWSRSQSVGYCDTEFYLPNSIMWCHQEQIQQQDYCVWWWCVPTHFTYPSWCAPLGFFHCCRLPWCSRSIPSLVLYHTFSVPLFHVPLCAAPDPLQNLCVHSLHEWIHCGEVTAILCTHNISRISYCWSSQKFLWCVLCWNNITLIFYMKLKSN